MFTTYTFAFLCDIQTSVRKVGELIVLERIFSHTNNDHIEVCCGQIESNGAIWLGLGWWSLIFMNAHL